MLVWPSDDCTPPAPPSGFAAVCACAGKANSGSGDADGAAAAATTAALIRQAPSMRYVTCEVQICQTHSAGDEWLMM